MIKISDLERKETEMDQNILINIYMYEGIAVGG